MLEVIRWIQTHPKTGKVGLLALSEAICTERWEDFTLVGSSGFLTTESIVIFAVMNYVYKKPIKVYGARKVSECMTQKMIRRYLGLLTSSSGLHV